MENKQCALALVDFFKKHKQKLQEPLAKKRKKKKKSKQSSLWHDDDSSSDEDTDPKTFVIVGPAATAKTSMVHAAAYITGARLLEVNCSDDRGNATLRRNIEEATQSQAFK